MVEAVADRADAGGGGAAGKSGAAGSGAPALHGLQLLLLTVAVASATFMEVLDTTIVNVSINSIAGSLGVSPSEATWTISSYALAAAIMQPLTGWLGRRFGEVRTFTTSVLLFCLTSALCGFATSMPMLVVGRLLQGLVSGPMVALAQAILLRSFPPEKRGIALSLWGMVVVVAPIGGPVVGGWITDNFSWPWLFFINLPIGLISAALSWRLLRKQETRRVHAPVDVTGMILLFIGVGALQYTLDNGNEVDWFSSPVIIASTLIAAVSLLYLVIWELTDRHPVIDIHLFRIRNFSIACVLTVGAFFAFMGSTVMFPLWLETTVGYTAIEAGKAMAPIGITMLVMMPIMGRNVQRMNKRVTITCGFLVISASMFWMMRLNEHATFWQLIGPRLLMGAGMPCFFLPINMIMMSRIKPEAYASAAGLWGFLRTLSGSIATAVSVFLWNRRQDYHHVVLAGHVDSAAAGWQAVQPGLEAAGIDGRGQHAIADLLVNQQASTLAINDLYLVFGLMFIVMLPILWLARPPFQPPEMSRGGAH